MTLSDMIEDLQHLVDKGYGNLQVEIYCKNCDCSDSYDGATGGSASKIQITVNK